MEKKILEIEVEQVENFKEFNKKDNKISIEIPTKTEQEVTDGLKIILSDIKKEELEVMTPFILKFIELQDVHNIKYDPENKEQSIEQYKHYNTLIAPSKVTAEFEPIYRKAKNRLDEINAMKKVFKEQVEKCKEVLNENFKEYVDEVNAKKEEAKAKKEAKDNAVAEEMKAKLEQAEEINKRQEYEKSILSVKEKINNISLSTSQSVQQLNIEGLATLRANIELLKFEQLLPQEVTLEEFDCNELSKVFNTAIEASLRQINDKIALINTEYENAKLIQETPQSLEQQEAPKEFSPFPTELPQGQTDMDRLTNYKNLILEYSTRMKAMNQEYINSMISIMNEIEDKNLVQFIQKMPTESAPKINQWMEAAPGWIEKIYNNYLAYYNSLNK